VSVVPFPPKGEGDDGVALTVADAKDALLTAANAPAMRREPYSLVLMALTSTLDAFAAGIEAMRRPMDDELRTGILAVYERQARQESASRLNMARMGNSNARRNTVLIGATAGLAVLLGGLGAFALGFSNGGSAEIARLCQGDAVREQDGGRTCAFWLTPPTRQAPRPAPKG